MKIADAIFIEKIRVKYYFYPQSYKKITTIHLKNFNHKNPGEKSAGSGLYILYAIDPAAPDGRPGGGAKNRHFGFKTRKYQTIHIKLKRRPVSIY